MKVVSRTNERRMCERKTGEAIDHFFSPSMVVVVFNFYAGLLNASVRRWIQVSHNEVLTLVNSLQRRGLKTAHPILHAPTKPLLWMKSLRLVQVTVKLDLRGK
eukprot:2674187-Pyramimonas_sp.AAC.2